MAALNPPGQVVSSSMAVFYQKDYDQDMKYLYETHLHTLESSSCGKTPGREYAGIYKDLGFTGIIVTDHFFMGNSSIRRSLPWREWVNGLCRGYEAVKEAGDKQGIDVFFGWEETFDDADDYLVYGLNKEWLWEHPEAASWTRAEQYRIVKQYGGCVVQAHPFRQHAYIHQIILSPQSVDAVEAANANNHEQSYDALAMRYAKKLNLPVTAGSDVHNVRLLNKENAFGVYLDKKIETIADYVTAIKENRIAALRIKSGRCDYHGDETVSLPVDIRDGNSLSTGRDLWDFLEHP
jgi:hypothetical protein